MRTKNTDATFNKKATPALSNRVNTPALHKSAIWNEDNSMAAATRKFIAAHTGA
jgi:hypothetical protein